MSAAIFKAPLPKGLDQDGLKQYKSAIVEVARPFQEQAVQNYISAIKKAESLEAYNAWVKVARPNCIILIPKSTDPLMKKSRSLGCQMGSCCENGNLAHCNLWGPAFPAVANGADSKKANKATRDHEPGSSKDYQEFQAKDEESFLQAVANVLGKDEKHLEALNASRGVLSPQAEIWSRQSHFEPSSGKPSQRSSSSQQYGSGVFV